MSKKIKLGDVVKISKGKKHTETPYSESSKRYIQIEDLSNSINEKFTEENGIDVKGNDVIIAWDGANAGKVGSNLEGVIGSTLARLRIINSDLNHDFLFRFLNSKFELIKSQRTGATIPHVSGEALRNLQIPLPNLQTQKHIASILDKADALCQQNRQLLAYYDALLQSTFIEMFGDPVENPKGWEVKKLGEIAEVVSGVAKNGSIKGDLIEAPYMRVANVQDGVLNLTEIKTINVFKRDFDKYQLKSDDILMTEGGDPDKLGRAAIWKEEVVNCIHQNHIFRVRPDFSIINSEFLCNQFGSSYGKRYFLKAAKQTTGIASINMTQLKNFPALLPPVSVQQRFGGISQEIMAQKEQAKISLAESEALFQGLLSTYFGNN